MLLSSAYNVSKGSDQMLAALKAEMTAYYRKMDMRPWMTFVDKDVEAKFAEMEHSKELIFKIKKMFGFGARELTKLENELFTKWTRDYGYGEDVIKLAYDIMINAIQKVQPKYADKILEKWHVEGLSTVEQIEKYESEKRNAPKTDSSDPQKSYDLDDFFEAAIKRSFEDLK